MKVLIDLNVVLDTILQRQPWVAEANAVWDAAGRGQIHGHLVATSLTNLFYITRRVLGRDEARRAVRSCLSHFAILAIDLGLLQQADALPGADFEDNVQMAAAGSSGLDCIVTRDKSGFTGAPVPVLTPAELLALLSPGSP